MNKLPLLSDDERATVLQILRAHLPQDAQAHIFGSRATGHCKPWSDLDIVIDAKDAIPLSLLASLVEAFDESSLPWKVDLVDRHTVSDGFAKIIDASKIPID
jgi:uncharacterized protein